MQWWRVAGGVSPLGKTTVLPTPYWASTAPDMRTGNMGPTQDPLTDDLLDVAVAAGVAETIDLDW